MNRHALAPYLTRQGIVMMWGCQSSKSKFAQGQKSCQYSLKTCLFDAWWSVRLRNTWLGNISPLDGEIQHCHKTQVTTSQCSFWVDEKSANDTHFIPQCHLLQYALHHTQQVDIICHESGWYAALPSPTLHNTHTHHVGLTRPVITWLWLQMQRNLSWNTNINYTMYLFKYK